MVGRIRRISALGHPKCLNERKVLLCLQMVRIGAVLTCFLFSVLLPFFAFFLCFLSFFLSFFLSLGNSFI